MELFEQTRRESAHAAGTVKGQAKKLKVHRRMMRQGWPVSPPGAQDTGAEQTEAGEQWRISLMGSWSQIGKLNVYWVVSGKCIGVNPKSETAS